MDMKKYRLGEVSTIIPGYAFKSSDFGCGKNRAIKIMSWTFVTGCLLYDTP